MIWVIQQIKVIHYKNSLLSAIINDKLVSNITPKLKDTVQHWIIICPYVIDYIDVNYDIRSNVINVHSNGVFNKNSYKQ